MKKNKQYYYSKEYNCYFIINKNGEIISKSKIDEKFESRIITLVNMYMLGYSFNFGNDRGVETNIKKLMKKLYNKFTKQYGLVLSNDDKKISFYVGLGQNDYKFIFKHVLKKNFLPQTYLPVIIEPLIRHLLNSPSNKYLKKSLRWILCRDHYDTKPIYIPNNIIQHLLLMPLSYSFYMLKYLIKYFTPHISFKPIISFENRSVYNKKMFIGCAAKEFHKMYKQILPICKTYSFIFKILNKNNKKIIL